ncbi:MAG: 50S ribosomal protein L11 methyltransferase [Thiohalomonadales bacterium]
MQSLTGFFLILLFSILSACSHHSLNHKTIEHPGSYTVIHLGYQKNNSSQFKTIINGREFLAEGTAYIPSPQSAILLENTIIEVGDLVLDVGTGAGVQAIFAAEKAKKVVATDINPAAVKSTQLNARLNGLGDKIDVRLGDLFAPLNEDEQFDVIISNIDYPYDTSNESLWKVHERFFAGVGKFLKYDGTIFYQSGWIRNIPRVMDMLERNGFIVKRLLMLAADEQAREPIVFTIKHGVK